MMIRILLFLFLAAGVVQAQRADTLLQKLIRGGTYSLLQGNQADMPYMVWKGWQNGHIQLTNGQHFTNAMTFKFSGATNLLYVRSLEDTTFIKALFHADVDSAIIFTPGKKTIIKQLDIPKEPADRLYQVLYIGSQYDVLKFPRWEASQNNEMKLIWREKSMYFIRNGGRYTKVKLKVKSLKNVLTEKQYLEVRKITDGDISESTLIDLIRQADENPE